MHLSIYLINNKLFYFILYARLKVEESKLLFFLPLSLSLSLSPLFSSSPFFFLFFFLIPRTLNFVISVNSFVILREEIS